MEVANPRQLCVVQGVCMNENTRPITVWVHIVVIALLAMTHFLIWFRVYYLELLQTLGQGGGHPIGYFLTENPLLTALSFPLILLPQSWMYGTAGILPYVGNSLLWGVSVDVLATLIWHRAKHSVSARHSRVIPHES